jgi:hypothetical protein
MNDTRSMAAWFAVFVVVVAFYYRSTQQARIGKGWLLKLGKRNAATFWQYALQVGESVQYSYIGQLDEVHLSTIRGLLSEPPYYMLALTDHGRFLLAPYSSGRTRQFKACDRMCVYITDKILEVPDPWLKLSPLYYLFGAPKTFTVTLVLPDTRFRLNKVDSHMVEALRRE